MSNIEKLLKGVEVGWKTVEEVAENVSSGGTPSTGVEEYYGGNIPWLRTQEVGNGEIWNTDIKITELGLKNSSAKMIPINCVIVAMYGATVGKVGINKIPLCTNQACANIQINEKIANYRYVYHFLLSQYEYIKSLGAGSQTNINSKIVKSLLIPIPCPNDPEKSLKIQKEIVRILDKFSSLTAELQAELQARKSQYDYYRNQLLTYPMEESDQPSLRSSRSTTSIQNSDNSMQPLSTSNPHTGNSVLQPRDKVEWKTLGEIGTLKIGRRFVRTDIQECGVPCFHYGDLYTFYGISATQTKGYLSKELAEKLRFAQPNDIIIVCAGENDMDIGVGVAWLGKEPAVVHDACCILHHNQNPRYISHFLRTHNYHLQIKKYVKNGKISSLPVDGLEKAIIPIPYPNDRKKSLKEQERIASILDKFDTLTTSITEGLPKEIELRQKQYEYYRDMLFTFPNDNIKA